MGKAGQEQARCRKRADGESSRSSISSPSIAAYAGPSLPLAEPMLQARNRPVSTEMTPFYHLVSRCMRRQFLCGLDLLTGRDDSGRKQETQARLALLSQAFAVDVSACAILSNDDQDGA
jgi:hypothetical protein